MLYIKVKLISVPSVRGANYLYCADGERFEAYADDISRQEIIHFGFPITKTIIY